MESIQSNAAKRLFDVISKIEQFYAINSSSGDFRETNNTKKIRKQNDIPEKSSRNALDIKERPDYKKWEESDEYSTEENEDILLSPTMLRVAQSHQ